MDNQIYLPDKIHQIIYKFLENCDFEIKKTISKDSFVISSSNEKDLNIVYFGHSEKYDMPNTILLYSSCYNILNSTFDKYWNPVLQDFISNKFGVKVDSIFFV